MAGARIVLVRSGDSTGQAQAISSTAGNGNFPDFQVPDGYYSVVVRDPGDSLGKYLDSVPVSGHKLPTGRDTLRALGRIRGVVRVGAGDSPATAVVGLIGTDILANVKADGTFSVELVPGGLYTLAASSSLQGYGPLYQRLSLKNGQDTLLSDTLVLPFTALPTPAGLKVVEDTATGNVKVSWSRVVFPDLLGYVLERVENGNVTLSQYLTDTVWTDSLQTYWESQPLLGPWPARNLAYRVRSRSVSGSPDSRSNAQAFQAVAPNWTKRVDSVKVTLVTDTVRGISEVRWNLPSHPDVVGSLLVRSVPGEQDCVDSAGTGHWVDSACGDPRIAVVSTSTDSGKISSLYRPQSSLVTFAVQAVRRSGNTENLSTVSWSSHSSLRLVQWRDSTGGVSSTASFTSFGGWLLWSEGGRNSKVSHDGVNWEEIPDQANGVQWIVTGQGDSLWMAKVADDSLHVVVASRTGPGSWVQRLYHSADSVQWLSQAVVDSGRFAVMIGSRTWLYRTGPGDSLVPVPGAGVFNFGSAYSATATLSDSGWMIAFSSVYGNASATVYQGDRIRSSSRYVQWTSQSTSFRAPIGNQGGYLFDYGQTPAYFAPNSDGYLLTAPGGGDTWSPQTATVFHDEIWAVVNGHLWKGALHLPPS